MGLSSTRQLTVMVGDIVTTQQLGSRLEQVADAGVQGTLQGHFGRTILLPCPSQGIDLATTEVVRENRSTVGR